VGAQASPNPFRSVTTIEFGVPRAGPVEINIYDVAGKRVRKLVSKNLNASMHKRSWDGRNNQGRKVPVGIYIAKIRIGSDIVTRKLVLLR